jgi:hypothetical protein
MRSVGVVELLDAGRAKVVGGSKTVRRVYAKNPTRRRSRSFPKKGVDKENASGGVKVQIAFRRWSDVRKKCYDSNWFSTHPAGVEYMSRAILISRLSDYFDTP